MYKHFNLLFSFLILLMTLSVGFAQEQIDFKRHKWTKNLITGNKIGYEIPIYVGKLSSSDYDYESTDAKGPVFFGVSFKGTLKNAWGRGLGLGIGADYTTNNYIRLNLLLDLDFLFHYSIDMGSGVKFTPSMFNKLEFHKVMAKENGMAIQEYYFSLNIMKFQFGPVALEYGFTSGLFRGKYVPYFADKGMYFKGSFIFSK